MSHTAGLARAIFAPDSDYEHHDVATIATGSLAEVVAAAEATPMEVQAGTTIYLEDLTVLSLADARARLAD